MSITPGKINKLDKRTLIYEAGDNVETICYIKKGSVTKETSTGSKTFSQGKFIGHFDLYDGFYSGTIMLKKALRFLLLLQILHLILFSTLLVILQFTIL